MEMVKYPSIEQYRHVIKEITSAAQFTGLDEDGNAMFNKNVELPVLKFNGTVKMHGTNAAVCYNPRTGDIWVQSRKRIITPEDDNAGFASFVEKFKSQFQFIFTNISEWHEESESIILYGEWCGGNIQKGIALNELDKMFVIFDVNVDGLWVDNYDYIPTYAQIHNITEFQTFDMFIDFNQPDAHTNFLIDITNQVEAECPVGKEFGVSGIGEGVVWTTVYNCKKYRFKVKGEKHSSSKVKKLVEVDTEKVASIDEFLDYAVTDNRLKQGIEEVFVVNNIEPEMKLVGQFIKWMNNDVFKEELDTLLESGLVQKDVVKPMSKKVVSWFKDRYY